MSIDDLRAKLRLNEKLAQTLLRFVVIVHLLKTFRQDYKINEICFPYILKEILLILAKKWLSERLRFVQSLAKIRMDILNRFYAHG